MSKTLIAKAMTNSEWDSVSFALVDLSKKFTDFLQEVRKDAEALNKKYEYGFLNIRISGDNADFYIGEVEDCQAAALLGEEEFMITDKGLDPDSYTPPENSLRHGQMKIGATDVQFVAYGKHTDEEFWTNPIPIEDLI